MAERSYSVAEARQNLARLIRTAEHGRAVRITRRGQPVAVLLSASEYLALSGESRWPEVHLPVHVRGRLGPWGRRRRMFLLPIPRPHVPSRVFGGPFRRREV